jgi:FAD/FMN-containing dehydrogenase
MSAGNPGREVNSAGAIRCSIRWVNMTARMLACRSVKAQTQRLRPPGALRAQVAQVVSCTRQTDLQELFAEARRKQQRLTLIGGQRSFGEHFLPTEASLGVDISALERGAVVKQTFADGRLLVRAGGGTRFEDLHAAFPEHRVRCVPTSDRITLAGALAACAHSAAGYFADSVQAFSLLTIQGETIECSADAQGRGRQLFDAVPGSFGALGVTTFLDLVLEPIEPQQLFGVHAEYAAPQLDDGFFAALDAIKDDPRFDEGLGSVIYGNRGRTLILADRRLPPGHVAEKKLQALLTDDDLENHAFSQGLANRFPRFAEATVTKTYPQGIVRWAPWYGFQFYQRGYDRASEVLSRKGLKFALARLLGVDARVPVAHQGWFFPRNLTRQVMNVYFNVLDEFPGLEKQVEQQDIVLLGPCPYPAHSLGRTEADVGVLTSSYSLAALPPARQASIVQFFARVSQQLYAKLPETRVSLCKQVHCDRELLRSMHRPWAELIRPLKSELDPQELLTSRHLEMLLGP